jgi:hypothetical protein
MSGLTRKEGDAVEVVSDHRQGGDLGRQGQEHVFAHRPCQVLGRVGGKPSRGQAHESLAQRRGVQHQAQSGHKGELKADVPQDVRAGERHQGGDQAQAVEAVLLAADLAGEQRQGAHQGGAHHGGLGADQEGVQPDGGDAQSSRQEAAALAQQLDEQGGEQAGQDGYVEPIKTNAMSMWFSSLWGISYKINSLCLPMN